MHLNADLLIVFQSFLHFTSKARRFHHLLVTWVSISSAWDSTVFRKYDSPVSSAEENHGIVMKPAPIMEEEEEGRWGRGDWGGEGGGDGGSRANEEERLAANGETIRSGKRVLVDGTRQRDSQRRRSRRRAWRRERGEEDGAVRDESEM